MRLVRTMIFAAALVSACDSNSDCGQPLRIVSGPDLLSVFLPDESSSLSLGGGILSYSRSPEDLTFSAAVLDEEIAVARLSTLEDVRLLTLEPVSAGSTELILRAVDTCGGAVEVTIAVKSIDICDASSLDGYDIFFPVEAGIQRRYRYESYTRGDNRPPHRIVATRDWEIVGQPSCQLGRQEFVIRETTEGILTIDSSYETPVSYTRDLKGSLVGRRLEIEDYTDRLPLPELFWLVGETPRNSLSVNESVWWNDAFGAYSKRIDAVVEKSVGLVHWTYRYGVIGESGDEELILIRDDTDSPGG